MKRAKLAVAGITVAGSALVGARPANAVPDWAANGGMAAAGAALDDIAVRGDVDDKAPPPLAAAALANNYNGCVDWRCPDKMPMEEALRAAAYWDAGGFTANSAFEAPL